MFQWITKTDSFWDKTWNKIIDAVGDNEHNFYVFVLPLLTYSCYWIIGGIFTFMDVTNKPQFLRKFKVQPKTNEPVDRKKLVKVSKLKLKLRIKPIVCYLFFR